MRYRWLGPLALFVVFGVLVMESCFIGPGHICGPNPAKPQDPPVTCSIGFKCVNNWCIPNAMEVPTLGDGAVPKPICPKPGCKVGSTRSCYPKGKKGCDGGQCKGSCRQGFQRCVDFKGCGVWEPSCWQAITPQTETCNGKDDDCDGQVDEQIFGCVVTIAGTGRCEAKDGPAKEASFASPGALAIDKQGDLWVADGHRLRKLGKDGLVTTVVGKQGPGYRDGKADEAKIGSIAGMAFDDKRNLYFTDGVNHRVRILNTKGEVLTVAGSGRAGVLPGNADEARFQGMGSLFSLNKTEVLIPNAPYLYKLDLEKKKVEVIAGANSDGKDVGDFANTKFPGNGILRESNSSFLVMAESRIYRTRLSEKKIEIVVKEPSKPTKALEGDLAQIKFDHISSLALLGKQIILSEYNRPMLRAIDEQRKVKILAGNPSEQQRKDGLGQDARFQHVVSLVARKDGMVFMSDACSLRTIFLNMGAK